MVSSCKLHKLRFGKVQHKNIFRFLIKIFKHSRAEQKKPSRKNYFCITAAAEGAILQYVQKGTFWNWLEKKSSKK